MTPAELAKKFLSAGCAALTDDELKQMHENWDGETNNDTFWVFNELVAERLPHLFLPPGPTWIRNADGSWEEKK